MNPSPAVEYRRARRHEQNPALSRLLTGRTDDESAVSQFRRFAGEHGFDLEQTWVAVEDGEPIATALIVPAAGRSAMIFVSRPTGRDQGAALSRLIRLACEHQIGEQIKLVQALLDPSQHAEAEALIGGGFQTLATLLYMQGRDDARKPALELPADMQLYHWAEAYRDRFARAILASYERTLDCPGLVGVRDIDDVIAGHQTVGRFDPAMWHAIWRDDEPVGVMLLNEMVSRRALELVYLGLSPGWRGHGLARRLVEHAKQLAANRGLSQIILAVDAANQPAMGLYRRQRFVQTGRKLAMIFRPQNASDE